MKRDRLGTLQADLRGTALRFPGAVEEIVWGHPCYKVRGKIFCTLVRAEDHVLVTTKLTREEQALFLADPMVSPAEYVGRHGWISARLTARRDLPKVKAWIARSFELVAAAKARARQSRRRA